MLVKNKKLFLAQIIGGACGGAFLGLFKVVTTAFVFGSVTTFRAFVSSDPMNFAFAMIGMVISAVVAGVLGYIFTDQDDQSCFGATSHEPKAKTDFHLIRGRCLYRSGPFCFCLA